MRKMRSIAEIISRYYYERGIIIASFKDDIQLKKAIEILSNLTLYNSILDGTYKGE